MEEPYDTLGGEAEDGDERDLGVFPTPSIEDCPIVFLGFDGPRVVFAMPEGEIRAEPAAKIGQMLRTDIMACAAGQAFLVNWRDRKDKFHRDMATVWFVRQCRERGKWDAGRPQRGLGVWPGRPGETLLHRGNAVEVWERGRQVDELTIAEALKTRQGPLYRLHPAAPGTAEPCGPEIGQWARRHFDAWRFEPIGEEGLTGADVVAGYVGLALLGAVAPFRVHVLLDALPGSGKTTFLAFVHALLSALAGEPVNSFTDAGLRKEVSGHARPLLIDEAETAESDLGPGPVEQVLALLRLMATGEGANRKQADAAQTALGAVLMAGANPPPLDAALATRVAQVRMRRVAGADPADDDPDARPRPRLDDAQLSAAVERAKAEAPALLGRALSLADRYRQDLAAIKRALVDAGEMHRSADLIASLAAGRRLLVSDDALDDDAAALEVARWSALAAERAAGEGMRNDAQEALSWLLAADSGVQRSGTRVTVGQLVEAQAHAEGSDVEAELKACGLRVLWAWGPDGREGPWLLVANKHPGTARIFARSRFKNWSRVLAGLDELGPEHRTWAHKPEWFGPGQKSRARAIPLAPWLEKPIRPRATGSVPGERSTDRSGGSP